MISKKIIVGFDFDGVIAYNPARLLRSPISLIKTHFLGVQKIRFFVPKNSFERSLWSLAHESSMFPALGVTRLRILVGEGRIEAHLVTSRFGFLEPNLRRFLKFWQLENVFSSITLNHKEEQPHVFKERMIRIKKFQYFIEDNWDIVSYLKKKNISTEVHWIYNIFDRNKVYPHKYPYLEKSLERITKK